ncbi:SET domain protein [Taphrina deformans PYCC 5710]|uniref:SET domain protein n=1 Tax=Taphrina deformans (strain PYCC 5710 / ATCC 11124 / CBS 356.35 / IMI 108563 / JCM 9778 / NBRC 8474) TaxID=1097556 RepID=R4XAJ7_TAPDE|nr:SET domain protein [Taphrina deformans PYCC 5710]|eukprot:CCG82532.1 SET domain protein [Taphrina deformans PYCC 5710]
MSHTFYKLGSTSYAGQALFATEYVPSETTIGTFRSYLTAQDSVLDASVKAHLKTLDFSDLPSLNEKLVLTLYLSIHHSSSECCASHHEIAMDQLPSTIQNGVWTADDLGLSQLGPAIEAKRRVLERQWSSLASKVCTFEAWKWADSIVSSRCLGFAEVPLIHLRTMHNVEEILLEHYTSLEVSQMFDLPRRPNLVLVPVLDLCNHAGPHRNARWDLDPSGRPHLLSTRQIEPGEEITISYGDEKTNDELFFNYGFVVPDNPNWSITLRLSPPSDIEAEGERLQYWKLVSQEYGLSDHLTFKSGSHLNFEEETAPVNKVMDLWCRKGRLGLTREDIAKLLLSTSVHVLDCELVVQIFSESGTECEVEEWNQTVYRTLLAELLAMLARLDGHLRSLAGSEIARQLLHDERTGCLTVLQALDGVQSG